MTLDLVHWFLCTNILVSVLESEKRQKEKELAKNSQLMFSLGAPDSVQCARLALVKRLLSGIRRRRTAKNHRTVWWCTGLSGEPTVGRAIRA
jgi:hypothetical protein